ncbi:MAG: DUF533 domain-containing protein [Verrucomicrobiota bacterium]
MDAVKILGSLLASNAMGSSTGGNILGSLLGGGGSGGGGGAAAANILGALMGGGQRQGSMGGLGALGGLLGAAAQARGGGGGAAGGLGALGSLLGGGAGSGAPGLGAIEGLLGGGGGAPQRGGGGLGGLLGGLLGGGGRKQAAGGGMGLESILGAVSQQGGGAGDMLGALLGAAPGPQNSVPQEAHDEAELLIQAMCNAAKADGQIDAAEQEAILGRLGDLDQNEVDYVRQQLATPLDVQGFISKVPADMAQQIYSFSLMAIKLDTQNEAQYFAQLAQGLGIDANTANQIHAQLGEPQIFQ